MKDVTVLYEKE